MVVQGVQASLRVQSLSLYRRLLRSARQMPTPNRRAFVEQKTRVEFRENSFETDPKEIRFLLMLGETNLDTVNTQANHLSSIFSTPGYHKT
mmetsp:Transcript_17577/g.35010  ORF Transcript_17577/g.35010 Transcript_17577/m.35010 type:complete len:91 (+) Transcript_17577:121-393(+)